MTPGPAASPALEHRGGHGLSGPGQGLSLLGAVLSRALHPRRSDGPPCTALELFTAGVWRDVFICTLWPYFEHVNEKKLIFAGFSLCALLHPASIGSTEHWQRREHLLELPVFGEPKHLCRWGGRQGDHGFPSGDPPGLEAWRGVGGEEGWKRTAVSPTLPNPRLTWPC